MDFKNVDKKYRAVPFWSWNDRLDAEETKRQVGVMDDAGSARSRNASLGL